MPYGTSQATINYQKRNYQEALLGAIVGAAGMTGIENAVKRYKTKGKYTPPKAKGGRKKRKRARTSKKKSVAKSTKSKMKKTTVQGTVAMGQKGDTKSVTVYSTTKGTVSATHFLPWYENREPIAPATTLAPILPSIVQNNFDFLNFPPIHPQDFDNRIKYWSSGNPGEKPVPENTVAPTFGPAPDYTPILSPLDCPGYDPRAVIDRRTMGFVVPLNSFDTIRKDDVIAMIRTHTHAKIVSCGVKYVSRDHGLKNSVITTERMPAPSSQLYVVEDVDGRAMRMFQGPLRTASSAANPYVLGEVSQAGLELLKHGGYAAVKKSFNNGNSGWLTWQPKTTKLEIRDRAFLENSTSQFPGTAGGVAAFYDNAMNYVSGGPQKFTRWSDLGDVNSFQTSSALLFLSWASPEVTRSEFRMKRTVKLAGKRYEPLTLEQATSIYSSLFVKTVDRLAGVAHDNSDRTGDEFMRTLMFGEDNKHPLCSGATLKAYDDPYMADEVFEAQYQRNFTGDVGDDEQAVLDDLMDD